MDYISREKLKQAMYHETFETDTELQKWESGCWIRYKLFENVIDTIPSADVEERKTGKWVSINEYLNHLQNKTGEQYVPSSLYNATPFCNQCWTSHDRKSNFCPNCGAKMEG